MSRPLSPPKGLSEAHPFPEDCAQKFRHRHRLGAGGFGAVFLAQQIDLGRPVAIKLLLEDVLTDEEQVERFVNEARATAAVSHPNIVAILDHGARTGIPWIAYELVEGQSLRELLEAKGRLSASEAIPIGIQIAEALAALHERSIIHRDIKPDNVMVTSEGVCKIMDLGIAKWTSGSAVHTRTGVVLGTPAYMAPELIEGAQASASTDLYALGVTLFELLTGDVPFSDENVSRLLMRHISSPAPAPSSLADGIPAAVDAIVIRTLAKTPAQRYTSASTLIEDLRRSQHTVSPDATALGVLRARAPQRADHSVPGPTLRAAGARTDAPARPGAAARTQASGPAVPLAPHRARTVEPRAAAALTLIALVALAWHARTPAPGVDASPPTVPATASSSAAVAAAGPGSPLAASAGSMTRISMDELNDMYRCLAAFRKSVVRSGPTGLGGTADHRIKNFEAVSGSLHDGLRRFQRLVGQAQERGLRGPEWTLLAAAGMDLINCVAMLGFDQIQGRIEATMKAISDSLKGPYHDAFHASFADVFNADWHDLRQDDGSQAAYEAYNRACRRLAAPEIREWRASPDGIVFLGGLLTRRITKMQRFVKAGLLEKVATGLALSEFQMALAARSLIGDQRDIADLAEPLLDAYAAHPPDRPRLFGALGGCMETMREILDSPACTDGDRRKIRDLVDRIRRVVLTSDLVPSAAEYLNRQLASLDASGRLRPPAGAPSGSPLPPASRSPPSPASNADGHEGRQDQR